MESIMVVVENFAKGGVRIVNTNPNLKVKKKKKSLRDSPSSGST